MAVNDKKVREIIDEVLRKHASSGLGSLQNCAAFAELYDRRNDPQNPNASLDEDLAAAEHYMLSRCWVSNGKYSLYQMKMWVLLYSDAKRLGLVPRHNPNRPHAPYSWQQTIWGLLGANAGDRDFRQYPPISQPSFGGWYSPPRYY